MNQQNFPRYHEPKPAIPMSQNETKYKNMRLMILSMFILSVVNCISVLLIDTYFYLSAYLPFSMILTGYDLAIMYESMAFYAVFGVLAIISLIPYLLCYIFSKKHVGWMIAALVMFSLDTLLMLVDLIYAPNSMIGISLIFHIYILVTFALGVKYGNEVKKEKAALAAAPVDPYAAPEAIVPQADGSYAYSSDNTFAGVTRSVTLIRKKSFVGCAVPFLCYVGNRQVATLKNGQTATFEITGETVLLSAGASNGLVTGNIQIPAGTESLTYEISMKMGMITNSLEIRQLPRYE